MYKLLKYSIFCLFIVICIERSSAQAVYEPVTSNPVYELLDELAALKVITLNSVVKPYSRAFIANKLNQALVQSDKLNKRQLQEVRFYLKDYSFENGLPNYLASSKEFSDKNTRVGQHPNHINRSDTLTHNPQPQITNHHPASFNLTPISFRLNTKVLKMSISPALGARFWINENGNLWEATGGGEIYGYLGNFGRKKTPRTQNPEPRTQYPAPSTSLAIGYYASVKYTHQSAPMVTPVMLTMEEGKSWTYLGNGSVENTEWRGGLSLGWKWGDLGIYKDRPVWGNANHGSNIMSGHPPSFPYIQLHLKPAKWIEFYSMTGFLKSNVIDSSRSTFTPGEEQIKYHKKYFSANFFTITPWKGLDFSFGNSIFWSDVFKVGYLIPFNLYKSVDQTLKGSVAYEGTYNTNDDGHLFLDICSRNIKHVQLYLGWWIDDWVSTYFLDPKKHNAFGWKLGACIYDLPAKNLSVTVEGSINRPRIYQEYIPAHTYAHDDYNFGNYLRDDSWELFISASYKPLRGLNLTASYNIAQKGGFIYNVDDYTTYPISKNLVFNETTINVLANYQIFTNLSVNLNFQYQTHSGDLIHIPSVYRGQTCSLITGFQLGF